MHQCEEFRERIAEHIVGREDIARRPEFQRELLICQSCSDFYSESREMIETFSSVKFEMPEEFWTDMTKHLRMRIVNDRVNQASRNRLHRWFGWWNARVHVPALAGIAAMALITFALYRLAEPLIEEGRRAGSVSQQVVYDHNVNLDPVTLEFLEQSELLLRNVMKLQSANVEDLQEARQVAVAQLMDINQRREAAAEVPPVVEVMDTYETILRDIRNLDKGTAAEDIADIQGRIQRNGMIGNMKVFQPKVNFIEIGQ